MAGGDRIIADAAILIEGDRIAAIGPRGSIAVPADTPVRDLGGRTVMPGFIDDHDHIGSIRRNVIGYEDWGLRARPAFRVTNDFDPSTPGKDKIDYTHLHDEGWMVGQRLR